MKNKLFLLIILLVFVASCSVSKKTIKEPIVDISKDMLVSKIEHNKLDFNRFKAKFEADIKINGRANSVSGNIKLANDSLIWVSVKPIFGIELYRFLLTADSAWLIDRFDRSYYSFSNNEISYLTSLPTDIETLQSLLLGDMADFNITYNSFSVKNKKSYLLYGKTTNYNQYASNLLGSDYDCVFEIDADNFKPTSLSMSNDASSIDIYNSDFTAIGNKTLPKKIFIKSKSKSDEVIIDIKYSNIEFNDEEKISFIIPSSYQKK
ncbi:MAG: DUF4292 domain-containing protein [Lentimicrobiaceae bacterium]|nr:DUF4292 domain-containing protein [Lentimicrobiaceae bacterium]